MEREKVFVGLPVTPAEAGRMQEALPEADFDFLLVDGNTERFAKTPEEGMTRERIQKMQIVIGNPKPEWLGASKELKWLQLGSAGADAYVKPGVLAPDTLLTTSVGAYGQAVAEHAFAMLLSAMKKLYRYQDDQRAHLWQDEGTVSTLAGARVLVLGAGDLGEHFASLCHAVGAECIALRRHVPTEPSASYASAFERTVTMGELEHELALADVVACFLPSTPETRGLASERFFAAMKEGSFFVNAGRGDLVVESALCRSLDAGHLAAAAIDVAVGEPLGQDSPLWDQKNLLVTPHVGGFWHLPATLCNVIALATENLGRYREGTELRNIVRH